MVRWNFIQRPLGEDVMEIKAIPAFNDALLGKSKWMFIMEKQSFWNWVIGLYIWGGSLWSLRASHGIGLWNDFGDWEDGFPSDGGGEER